MSRWKWLLTVTALVFWQSLLAADDPAAKDVPSKYQDLIRSLASPNREALTENRGTGRVKFPAGYDTAAQDRIDAARETLRDNFDSALPFLIAAMEDERYCMTADWAEGDGFYNRSVGKTCREIIASQLEIYRENLHFAGPREWHDFAYPISKDWFRTRTDRSLVELQLEAVEWAIARRKKFPAKSLHADAAKEFAELQQLRDVIAKSGKTRPPRRLLPMVTRDRPDVPGTEEDPFR